MHPPTDLSETLTGIADLAPPAQIVALLVLGAIAIFWLWQRRIMAGSEAAALADALKLTAQAQLETAASLESIAKQVEAVADDLRTAATDLGRLTATVAANHRTLV